MTNLISFPHTQDDYEGIWNVVAFLLAFVCCVFQVNVVHIFNTQLQTETHPCQTLPDSPPCQWPLCVHSATSTCSTRPWRNSSPSLCWVRSSYATSTCMAWGTCGSWSSTFQSPPSPPSSSSPANSKTEPMTVGSEEWRTDYRVAPLAAPGENDREANGCLWISNKNTWTLCHYGKFIKFLVYSMYLHFVYIVSETLKSIQWNAVLSVSLKVSG